MSNNVLLNDITPLTTHYTVVVNDEEQYSIWPSFKKVPNGWTEIGFIGSKEDCLAHIKVIWVDMRPLSLRKKMLERSRAWSETKQTLLNQATYIPQISPTVTFLSQGKHPVTVYPANKNCQELRNSLIKKHLHLTFTDTHGKTSITIKVDSPLTSLNEANLLQETGSIQIHGTLVLDYIPLKCAVEINLPSLEGTGYLEFQNLAEK